MRFSRSSQSPKLRPFVPELRVVRFIATRRDDPERGPMIWLSPADARIRMLVDGELAWIQGPRWQQVAPVVIDETVPEHGCILRDIAGVAVSESVRVLKPNFDSERPSPSGSAV